MHLHSTELTLVRVLLLQEMVALLHSIRICRSEEMHVNMYMIPLSCKSLHWYRCQLCQHERTLSHCKPSEFNMLEMPTKPNVSSNRLLLLWEVEVWLCQKKFKETFFRTLHWLQCDCCFYETILQKCTQAGSAVLERWPSKDSYDVPSAEQSTYFSQTLLS